MRTRRQKNGYRQPMFPEAKSMVNQASHQLNALIWCPKMSRLNSGDFHRIPAVARCAGKNGTLQLLRKVEITVIKPVKTNNSRSIKRNISGRSKLMFQQAQQLFDTSAIFCLSNSAILSSSNWVLNTTLIFSEILANSASACLIFRASLLHKSSWGRGSPGVRGRCSSWFLQWWSQR